MRFLSISRLLPNAPEPIDLQFFKTDGFAADSAAARIDHVRLAYTGSMSWKSDNEK